MSPPPPIDPDSVPKELKDGAVAAHGSAAGVMRRKEFVSLLDRRDLSVDLAVTLDAPNPALLVAKMLAGEQPPVQIEGDAQLAGDVKDRTRVGERIAQQRIVRLTPVKERLE